MRYNNLEIKPNPDGTEWEIKWRKDHHDRGEKAPVFCGLGFGWFPEDMTIEESFTQLKNRLIKSHQDKIDDLTKSLEKLLALELEEDSSFQNLCS